MTHMRFYTIGALLLTIGGSGCNDFLSGPKLTEDPNSPAAATADQRFVASQAAQFTQFEGALARTACIFMQQCAGVDRQAKTLGVYDFTEDDFSPEWDAVYTGGGLVDLRKIQEDALAAGDSIYAGVAKVWEALVIGTAADIWGDIPYSEAISDSPTPALDPQEQVYAAVQQQLDTAIIFLQRTGPTNVGPGAADLIYGGDPARWLALAHTLKARFFLHTAERDPGAYASALAEAQLGIQSPAADFRTVHTTVTTESNIWYQFMIVQRDSYVRAGRALVDLLVSRSDPRLSEYFAQNAQGGYGGADPGEAATATTSNLSAQRLAKDFGQPLVSWAETELIVAEAAHQTGDDATALQALNAVRSDAGLPTLSGLSGQALLDAIMTEKYVALFQNIEVWSDYKRTCTPSLAPAPGASEIPGRLYYGFDERNANADHIPPPSQQPVRNWNDPNACT